ncbi:PIR protein [Plasmodium yoelii]|uniref:PIR protein n=2 Tax=Plasmodium yoelii TaxID=5861 RepID=A0AAE9WQV4_PLAYO|nr:PIR protein [Plasmodium yoelii]WBY58270.1 PIR protein [Plasmodium yoelii yoelii]CDS44884.1 YIR protein [Plasmodium yoelii]VTZ79189.1 PIR protein [Plasmodium yoelii]|eukprot:XP_022811159.1 PIR protein [Plasmodium yoelii]
MPVNLCDGLTTADNGLVFDRNSKNYTFSGSYTNKYCPDNNCDNDNNKKISSAFIGLLGFYKEVVDMKNMESDKIAEYAILWLCHILNQKTENGTTTLNDFYTEHIKKNSHYNQETIGDSNNKIKIDVIDAKIKSMNMNIKDISNFYEIFKLLCMMDGEVDKKNLQCNTCLKNAKEFYEKYEKLKNGLDINKGSSYFQLLYSLSNDYDKFKEKYKKVCSNTESFEACSRSSVTKSPVTECPVTNSPVTNSPMTNCPVTECPVTKNTLITIAIIFVASSILLGVSYKYSLFGFRKRSQKQHLRENLKK